MCAASATTSRARRAGDRTTLFILVVVCFLPESWRPLLFQVGVGFDGAIELRDTTYVCNAIRVGRVPKWYVDARASIDPSNPRKCKCCAVSRTGSYTNLRERPQPMTADA